MVWKCLKFTRKMTSVQNCDGIEIIKLYTAHKVIILEFCFISGVFKIFEHYHVLHTWIDMGITRFHRLFGFESIYVSDFTDNVQSSLIT